MNGHGNAAAPPPSTGGGKRRLGKTGCLLIGLGCLGLLLLVGLPALGMLMWFRDDMANWVNKTWSTRATTPTGGIGGSPFPGPRGGPITFLPSVEYVGSPKGDRMHFEMQFYVNVMAKQAMHASNIRGSSELEAKIVFAADGTSGTATVDLSSPDKSRKGTMHLSFELDDTGQNWEFTLEKIEGP